jgi:membrane protease YdiL (CAAX protease family)
MKTKRSLWVEFFGLFILLPILIIPFNSSVGRFIIPVLLLSAFIVYKILKKDDTFDNNTLWKGYVSRKELIRIFLKFIPGLILLSFFTYYFMPDMFLTFPRQVPVFWMMVMIMYPLASVYPQELIFRTFIFHRYQDILPRKYLIITASALSFGLYHLFFGNWIAPVLSLGGGFIFACTYYRTRSTAATSLEHALWGDLIFTVGLGMYFYGGNI